MARVTLQSRLLILTSLVLLSATAFYVLTYGQEVYFLVFHRPFHVAALVSHPRPYVAPALPTFHVTATQASPQLTAGEVQHLTVSVLTNQTVSGFLEVWITAPNNRQVYKSPPNVDTASPVTFWANRTQTYDFTYPIVAALPQGTYRVSERITSPDQKTDYQLHEAFASFTVH